MSAFGVACLTAIVVVGFLASGEEVGGLNDLNEQPASIAIAGLSHRRITRSGSGSGSGI